MILRQFICKPGNSTAIIVKNCSIKRAGPIGTDLYSAYIELDAVKPLSVIRTHVEVYYKYQVYKKFPIDYWEDMCAWLNEKKRSFLMDWTLGRSMEYLHYDGKFRCPFQGNITFRFDRLSINKRFPMIPLLPSGNYITDTKFFEKDTKNVIVITRMHVTISDTRVEQY